MSSEGTNIISNRPQQGLAARSELRNWALAHEYWSRSAKFLALACGESNADVQDRYASVAEHYRMLAEAEERSADRKGLERRSLDASH
jgi:hypothetical protein